MPLNPLFRPISLLLFAMSPKSVINLSLLTPVALSSMQIYLSCASIVISTEASSFLIIPKSIALSI